MVSLGSCCCITYLQLAFNHIFQTNGHSPFDWISTPNFEKVITGLKEKFIHLDNFEKKECLPYYTQVMLFNDIYDIILPHYNVEGYFERFPKRYNRLIDNIKSTEYVLFVRKNHKEIDILMSFEDAVRLYKPILGPKNILLVINEYNDTDDIYLDIKVKDNIIFMNTYGVEARCSNGSRHYWNFIISHIRSILEFKIERKLEEM